MKYLDYYTILKISPAADIEKIRKSFRTLAKIHHPDKRGNTPDSQIIFRSILEAYSVLSDPGSRRSYDSYIRNSVIIKSLSARPDEKEYRTLDLLMSQLNYILWEIEDLLGISATARDHKSAESVLADLLIRLDRTILTPSGFGDHYFSARKLDSAEPETPLLKSVYPDHTPYTGIEDYYFQIRKRTNLFIKKTQV